VAERLHVPTSAQDLYNRPSPFCRGVHFPIVSTKKAVYAGEVCVRELKVELLHLKLEIPDPQGRTRKKLSPNTFSLSCQISGLSFVYFFKVPSTAL